MQILKASIEDVHELTDLVNAAYRGESSKKGWTNESHLLEGARIDEETFSGYFIDPSVNILKCKNEANQIIGCVHLQQNEKSLYLGMLTVKPELQSSGIGRALLQKAEGYAKQLKCGVITMTVISSRLELIAYYERRGYYKTGESKPFPISHQKFGKPKEPLELITMEKWL